jgi:hypothetical protein
VIRAHIILAADRSIGFAPLRAGRRLAVAAD